MTASTDGFWIYIYGNLQIANQERMDQNETSEYFI